MKAWIHCMNHIPGMNCLDCWRYNVLRDIFLDPLVPPEYCLNTKASLNIVADLVFLLMTTIGTTYGYFQLDISFYKAA